MNTYHNDSDEDNEVYFLKSVNEYNILEKIEQANRELFAELNQPNNNKNKDNDENGNDNGNNTENSHKNKKRRVTFAENLESYAPPPVYFDDDDTEAEVDNNKQIKKNLAENRKEANKAISYNSFAFVPYQSEFPSHLPTVDEEHEDDNQASNSENFEYIPRQTNISEINKRFAALCFNEDGDGNFDEDADVFGFDDDDIPEELANGGEENASTIIDCVFEEIDEDLQAAEMEEHIEKPIQQTTTTSSSARRITKQVSMAIEDNDSQINNYNDNIEERDDESINEQSLSVNDKIQRIDESVCDIKHEKDNANQLHDDDDEHVENEAEAEHEKDEDEDNNNEVSDDGLSMVVAKYLPDESGTDINSNNDDDFIDGYNAVGSSSRFDGAKTFCRRLMFGHKNNNINKKNKNYNSITKSLKNKPKKIAMKPRANPNQDIKFNYKICCEYRQSEIEKLPKYTGYLSEYGLSREQLAKRQEQLDRKKQYNLEQTLKTNEKEMLKMKDNERAFTSWLKNKIRLPINKTRNMFDVKKIQTPMPGKYRSK